MSNDTYRQRPKPVDSGDLKGGAPDAEAQTTPTTQQSSDKPSITPQDVAQVQRDMAGAESATQFSGGMPPQLQEALKREQQPQQQHWQEPHQPQLRTAPGNPHLEELLSRIGSTQTFDEVQLPSRGIAYPDDLPNGLIHVRNMTGEEEQILATPKYVRTGAAMNMIYKRCIKESINPESLLTADRLYLLIYLRGISYGIDYEIEVKCPDCNNSFPTTVNLNEDVRVRYCPSDFDASNLSGKLPKTGFTYTYRLSTGKDENELNRHREHQTRTSEASNDTLTFRMAQLLVEVEGVTDKRDLQLLIRRLPISDVTHLRNEVNEPPFGVDTEVGLSCPMCFHEFHLDLPMETNFFFPRQRQEVTEE